MSAKKVETKVAIGIDLGTTNSCVAIEGDNGLEVISNSEGAKTTPSVVAFEKGDTSAPPLVGVVARRQSVTNHENTIYASKRLIGRKFDDTEITKAKLTYKVIKGNNNDAWISANGKSYSPSQIGAFILTKMKQTAESHLGREVSDAVITVPAYFNDAQRQATKDAGVIAGLNVLRIINEPTAAAVAYGLDNKDTSESKIVVYDFGGGTFDVSVLELGDGVFEVKSTDGDTALGGEDCDNIILNHLIKEFKKTTGIDVSNDMLAVQRIKEAAEKAKIELSTRVKTEINLPFLTITDDKVPKNLVAELTRSQFEAQISDLVRRTMDIVKKALKESGFAPSDIDEVLLVGGSTRIPLVASEVKKFFGKEPNRSVNPDEIVAKGAAIQASRLCGGGTKSRDVLLLDVTPLSVGIETMGGVFTSIIPKNTTIPVKKSQVFSTAADNQPSVVITVLQGVRHMAHDNKVLGTFSLDGIPPAPRGIPQIEVVFDIDADGMLNVSAKDKGTNKEHSIRIDPSGGLSKDEIARMTEEAEAHTAEDEKRKELAEAKNEADSLIYNTEKTIAEHSDKLPQADKEEVAKAVESLKENIKTDDAQIIKSGIEQLGSAAQKLGAAIYQKPESANSGGSSGSSKETSSSDEEGKVVDSNYEECDNDKK